MLEVCNVCMAQLKNSAKCCRSYPAYGAGSFFPIVLVWMCWNLHFVGDNFRMAAVLLPHFPVTPSVLSVCIVSAEQRDAGRVLARRRAGKLQ